MSKGSYEGGSNRFYIKDDFGYMKELSIQLIEQTPVLGYKSCIKAIVFCNKGLDEQVNGAVI